ncbi:MAG TPA: hypothetical protein VKT82_32850 [Ktedonobacterales bacterium]|nr:hypothetical protein [Ktedonobacterales bacterium]
MPNLKTCLEEIILMGEGYVLNSAGYSWRPKDLLQWLQRGFPQELLVQVQLLRPNAGNVSGIYELDKQGEWISTLPLYYLERVPQSARSDTRSRTPASIF